MEVVLICGYSKTGKDTLYKQICGQSDIPLNWIAYHHGELNSIENTKKSNYKRGAFADVLKREVNQMLNVPEDYDYEANKDNVYKDGKTLRYYYIEHAAKMRDINPDHWVEQLMKDYIHRKNEPIVLFITDWRYPNELEYIKKYFDKVLTVRVFRKEVKIPNADVISEHQLHDVSTDLLLVRDEADFALACEIFHQYENYET